MLRIGQEEADKVAEVIHSGKIFRYGHGGQCSRFEERWAKLLGVKHAYMTSSGTTALTAALIGMKVGPGDEVLVPACTYMATAVAVLAAGAIPVVVDIDESTLLDPKAVEAAIGPQTRAMIPVHMWGMACDMKRLMRIARKHKLLVLEDACQAVGGGYEGKMLGGIGDVGAFSFNYFKNMTCGEGGCIATNNDRYVERARCQVDCCSFYWNGRDEYTEHFVSNGARASEFEGGILNAQLDRLPAMIRSTRRQKKRILKETAETGLTPAVSHSIDYECGTTVVYILPSAEQATAFAAAAGGGVMINTGRHVYTEWAPILQGRGAHHPALDPYQLKENRKCRRKVTPDSCKRSLDILSRAVMIGTHPNHRRDDTTKRIRAIRRAAKDVL
jgi:dTDP-4-amino-4,6-dideoxygalactose transaminase